MLKGNIFLNNKKINHLQLGQNSGNYKKIQYEGSDEVYMKKIMITDYSYWKIFMFIVESLGNTGLRFFLLNIFFSFHKYSKCKWLKLKHMP